MNDVDINLWDSDSYMDKLLRECDDTVMSLPSIEFEPHILISKVRKHYMEYLIQLLCINYERSHRLVNKNMKFPSAIWRCAKGIEMKAAQTSMMVQLYRRNIVPVIKEVKKDTKRGRLFKNLNDCLNCPPANVKKSQTTFNKNDGRISTCTCSQVKKRRISKDNFYGYSEINKIPVINNVHNQLNDSVPSKNGAPMLNLDTNQHTQNMTSQTLDQTVNDSPTPNGQIPSELQNSDEIMTQLEKLFYEDPNDDDDLFERTLCDSVPAAVSDTNKKYDEEINEVTKILNTINENQAAQIKSLQDRLATLEASSVNLNTNKALVSEKCQQPNNNGKIKTSNYGKWLCEEYFQRVRLFQILDDIGDSDRKKLSRIKEKFVKLFGTDSDDEGVISPLDETQEFIISCKERIAPWVVSLLTPYYTKGRIRGKVLFKSLVKYLIKLIYQCSHYPQEYEVKSFIQDFLENHKMIKCEADFQKFRIENL